MNSVIKVVDRMKDGRYNIDDLRGVIALGALRPLDGGTQTFVFDNVDNMSERCQNALLKFIEEPSDYNRFVFTAENKAKILPTVLSRVVITEIKNDNTTVQDGETAKAIASALARKNEYETLAVFSRIKDRLSLTEVLKLLLAEFRDALYKETELMRNAGAGGLLRAADAVSEYVGRMEFNPNMTVITTVIAAEIFNLIFNV